MTVSAAVLPDAAAVALAELPKMIRARRERDGLSLRSAGQRIGVAGATIDNLEHGRVPDLGTLLAVLAWLEMPLSWFDGRDGGADAYRRGWDDCAAAVGALLAAGPVEHSGTAADRRSRMPFDQIPHGEGGYKNYGCRCEVCRPAGAEANRRQREARKSRKDGAS